MGVVNPATYIVQRDWGKKEKFGHHITAGLRGEGGRIGVFERREWEVVLR